MLGQSFFSVEIGGWGYCLTSLESCLLHLGFPGKLVQPILKFLSLASLLPSKIERDSKDRMSTTSDPVTNVYLKNEKQNLTSCKPIHSQKR